MTSLLDGTSEPEYLPPIPDRPRHWEKSVFDVMEWRRFEQLIERLFQQSQFYVRTHSRGPDRIFELRLYPDQDSIVATRLVHCRHGGHQVGVESLHALRAMMRKEEVTRGRFVTDLLFTDEARSFAAINQISLYDGPRLLIEIAKRSVEERRALFDLATQGEFWRPSCPSCGHRMLGRTPEYGGGRPFWVCSTAPACRTVIRMRDR